VFEELTQAEKEYMKFVDSQVQILQDTVDTILNNVVKYHDEVCPEPKEICRENYTQIFISHFNMRVAQYDTVRFFNPEMN
jgi:hypothetical protein